jgi:Domain of unknown function (DUF4190)
LRYFLFPLPCSIVAVILGHLSLSDIRRSAGRLAGRGVAIAGLVFGYVGLWFVPILLIAAIAIPNVLRAKIAATGLAPWWRWFLAISLFARFDRVHSGSRGKVRPSRAWSSSIGLE